VTDAAELKRRRDLFFEDVARAFDAGIEVAGREAEQGKDSVEVARQVGRPRAAGARRAA
jgi:hypothetical protein